VVKAEGKQIRKPVIQLDSEEMRALKKKGLSFRAIAKKCGVSRPTVLVAFNGERSV
jgi:lambda repressor-like predicted transcriptional regulator